MKKLYESKDLGMFVYMDEEKVKEMDPNGEDFKEVPSHKTVNVSALVSDEYVDFFTDPNAPCEAVFANDGTNAYTYPELMERFRSIVLKAVTAVDAIRRGRENKPVWAKMREKYYGGKAYVYPDEMIEHLEEFSVEELVAFLHYCVIYKERFCDGAYGGYAKEGFIGRVLLRLRELSLEIDPYQEENGNL